MIKMKHSHWLTLCIHTGVTIFLANNMPKLSLLLFDGDDSNGDYLNKGTIIFPHWSLNILSVDDSCEFDLNSRKRGSETISYLNI